MQLICGIDEAGRGAVIGPLVLAGILVSGSEIEKLRKINVKDSKLLTRAQREELFGEIIRIVRVCRTEIIPPSEIDNAVKGDNNLNLNWLEAEYSAKIINFLNPDKAIIDCPTPNTSAYRDYIQRQISNKGIELLAEHRADSNYEAVSAASIIAKVTRDNEIGKIKQEIDIDFGSGYPSDPLTAEFLETGLTKFPEIFRKSWMPVRNLEERRKQKSLYEF